MLNLLGDSTIGTVRGWLGGLSRRQQAISNNIANVDTPGYRAQDVSFESELRRSLGSTAGRLATTSARHIANAPRHSGQLGTQAAQALTSQRRDGNDVYIDQEMVKLAETQMRYQAAASALNSKLASIRNVIRGT